LAMSWRPTDDNWTIVARILRAPQTGAPPIRALGGDRLTIQTRG
jgi:hypothetical protein